MKSADTVARRVCCHAQSKISPHLTIFSLQASSSHDSFITTSWLPRIYAFRIFVLL